MSQQLEHATTQAHEQGPSPGTPPNEHPQDLRSRPNDAHNQHKAADTGIDDVNYPPQLHAGKVGLGPHYKEQNSPSMGEKIKGMKEEVEGRITHNTNLEQEGHDRVTGELLRRKKQEEEHENPFNKKKN